MSRLLERTSDIYSAFLLQWEIYDAYIADQEKQRLQEEVNKQKAAAKKATAVVETAETSQDPAKVCLACCVEAMLLQPILFNTALCKAAKCQQGLDLLQVAMHAAVPNHT